MRWSWYLILSVAGTVSVPVTAAAQSGSPTPELKKIHVLLVFDTVSDQRRNFNEALRRDLGNLKALFERIPSDRREIKELVGSQANRRVVLDYYDKLKVKPDEGLIFYYGGHGALDTRKKPARHFFQIKSGALYRDELLAAMTKKGSPLVILLSDCCSSNVKVADLPRLDDLTTPKSIPGKLDPRLRALFFQARGTIDVTAASASKGSWSDPMDGGIFTRTFCGLLQKRQYRDLDLDRDGRLTWPEFFKTLEVETNKTFKKWKKDLIARGKAYSSDFAGEDEQIPTAFQLPRLDKAKLSNSIAEQSHAVFGVRNSTREAFAYKIRWDGGKWQTGYRIAPGKTAVHSLALAPGRELPSVEVEFDEKLPGVQRWRTHEAMGNRPPTVAALTELYEIYEPKK